MDQKQKFVHELLNKMTIEEKIGQLYQTAIMGEFDYGPAFEQNDLSKLIKEGKVGSLIGPYDNEVTLKLQKLAVNQSRLGIPLLLDNDIIHGCRTGFPVNLALAGSFDPKLVKESFDVIAYETSHSGTHVTLAPMLDIVRDPRWGRVVESPGEDPYLAEKMADAYIKGWQGEGSIDENHVGACLKHFVGYGASEAGREYNHVDISKRMLKQVYLKPFEAGIKAGAKMVMTAFNVYDDIPITANQYLLRDVLRNELKFRGVTISDYTSSEEIMNHKVADTKKEVAKMCLEAGLDIELISTTYLDELKSLSSENQAIKDFIDEACERVLTLKYELGLFSEPFKNIFTDFENYWLLEESRKQSLEMAKASIVMLKNNDVLPLNKHHHILLTGPFAKTDHLVGPWGGKVRNEDCITFDQGLEKTFDQVKVYETPLKDIEKEMIDDILCEAKDVDIVILTLGEHQWESGEAHSKTNINVEKSQVELAKQLHAIGKKVVGVVFAGRPLVLTEIEPYLDSILYAWFLGTETGDALSAILLGTYNPSARLAMTFPKAIGQIPIYYNHMKTGRPLDLIHNPNNHYASRYLDCTNEPLYPFGFGLSYAQFEYKNVKFSYDQNQIHVSFDLTNTSDVFGFEIIQVYIEAMSFSVTRPVNELKYFEKVGLDAHEIKHISFAIHEDELRYYNKDMVFTHEHRTYKFKLARNAEEIIEEQQIKLKSEVK